MQSIYRIITLIIFTSVSLSFYPISLSKAQVEDFTYTPVVQVTKSADGDLIIDGQPFFPFGFYHSSWRANGLGEKRRGDLWLQDLNDLAAGGFNIMHPTFDGNDYNNNDIDDYIELSELAEQKGVKLIVAYPKADTQAESDANIANFTKKFRTYKSIIGYDIADDFNNEEPINEPSYIQDRADRSHEVDPYRLVYGAATANTTHGSNPEQWEPYSGIFDVMGIEAYPVGNWSYNRAMEASMMYYRNSRDESPANKTRFALVQTFRWSDTDPYPNEKEIINLTFGGLVYGVNGILAYTYYPVNSVQSTLKDGDPALWNYMKTLRTDISELEPILLNGELHPVHDSINIDNPSWHGAYWKYQNKVYAVVVNGNRSQTLDVDMQLPDNVSGTPQAMFDGRYGSGMQLTGTRLTGTIAPDSVHVYEIATVDPNASCIGDFNDDGSVNSGDFGIFAANYKQESIDCSLDLADGDCRLTANDFGVFGQVYKQECTTSL